MTPETESHLLQMLSSLNDRMGTVATQSAATTQSVNDLRDGLKTVIPEMRADIKRIDNEVIPAVVEKVAKVSSRQNWIVGVGSGLAFIFGLAATYFAGFGLHK